MSGGGPGDVFAMFEFFRHAAVLNALSDARAMVLLCLLHRWRPA